MDPYLSRKIATFHAIGIVFVMLNHCGYENMLPFTRIFTEMFANNSRWAICMYFFIAGYLFYIGLEEKELYHSIFCKYKRRVKSLLMPFLLWSLWGTILYTFLFEWGLRDEWTVMAHNIANGSLLKLFLNPGMLQMWFVRDLIWCNIIAIPLFFLIKRLGLFIPLLFFAAACFKETITFVCLTLSFKSLVFFSLGACFSLKRWNIDTRKISRKVVMTIFVVSLGAFSVLAISPFEKPLIILPLTILSFYSFWLLYDKCSIIFEKVVVLFSMKQRSFFMFASFEPLYYLSKYFSVRLFDDLYYNHAAIQVLLLMSMYVCVFVLINGLAWFVSCSFPSAYNILTGSRN